MRNKKKKSIFVLKLCFLTGLFVFSRSCLASENDLIVTEIMYNPAENENGKKVEWIEMYVNKDISFPLKSNKQIKDFYLCTKETADGESCANYYVAYLLTDSLTIEKGNFIIGTKDPDIFRSTYGDLENVVILKLSSSFNLLSNDDSFIAYSTDNKKTWKEEIEYDKFFAKKLKGYSLEKINFNGDNSQKNWQESYNYGGTPGETSSKKKTYSSKIIINEILPNPSGDDSKDEFVELYNSGSQNENLQRWFLMDAGKHTFVFDANYCQVHGCEIGVNSYFKIFSRDYDDGNLTLNNTGTESIFLFDPNCDEVSRVSYSGAKENLSYNFDGTNWRWSRFLTPGEKNKFNQLPDSKIKEDKNIYVGVYADFEAQAKDKDKDKLKFTWDFGDGHKSYKKKTRHKYEKAGKYTVTLKIFDGSEEKIKTFKIEVKKLPKAKVKITSLSPNPSGKDSDFEWIEIENKSKSKINLKGWSVATGSKKLYNHPITEDFVIEKEESKKLTRDICKFTLNNKKNKIELRYPDGKVADKVKYKKEGRSVEEDEIYEKTQNGWQWLKSQSNTENAQNNTEELLSNTELQNYGEEIVEEDFSEFSGGQSVIEGKGNKMKELVNYGVKIRLANYDVGGNPRVLGISTEKRENSVYQFTEARPAGHYAAKFFKNLLSAINCLINKLIGSFY